MELIEQIKDINYYLQREYGVHEDGRPKFRVVFSNDQYEKRWVDHTDEGWPILYPEVREVRKYLTIKDLYILEQLSVVPENDKELTVKLSYEPLWVFRDRFDHYLPPRYDACKIIIDNLYLNMGVSKPPKKEDSEEVTLARKRELDSIEEKLFGNETPVGDALSYGWGVVNPSGETKLGGIHQKEKSDG